MTQAYRWTFFRAGGFDQVKLESVADLEHLDELDLKLWVALACPSTGLNLDTRTLSLVDSDKDGRVRAPELIAAVKFAIAYLKEPDDLLKGKASLPLASIDDSTPEGKTLLASARQILQHLGKPSDAALSCDDFSDTAKIFADTAFNGDGVVTELSSDKEDVRALLREIMDTIGGVPDRSGKDGVSAEQVAAFFEEAQALPIGSPKAPPMRTRFIR